MPRLLLTDEEILEAKAEYTNSVYPHVDTGTLERLMRIVPEDNYIAKAELKKVAEWGNEDCPHLSVMYGGFPPRKHECKQCWQALLKEAE